MDYLTGHILSAWLLTGCYTACFVAVVTAKCLGVTAGTPDLSDWIRAISGQCA